MTTAGTARLRAAARPSSSMTVVLGVVALACWAVAVHGADFSSMGALGLVTVLSPIFFVGLALAVVAFAWEVLRTPMRPWHLGGHVALLALFIFGTASAIEPVAGLTVSWVHAGYVLYIFNHGQVLNNYNAEFSWPGGFSLGAMLVGFTGQHDAIALLRWFPLVIELLYLPALLAIARYSGVGRRAGWLGIAVFYTANWIYQDYYSPQALNYLFFLVVVAVVLAVWQPGSDSLVPTPLDGLRGRLAQTRRAVTWRRLGGYDATSTLSPVVLLGVLGALGVVVFASAVSHQLTPYAIGLACLACLLARRLGRPELLVLVGLLAVGWLSLGASNFWLGHLSSIFGGFGALLSNYNSNVSNRIAGSASHRLIVDTRILITAAVFGVAAIGALRRRPATRVLEMLVIAPFLLLAAQNYGGEGLLRVALFSLPFTSLLAAAAILPNRTGPIAAFVPRLPFGRHGITILRAGIIALVLCVATATVVVRGGNDAYESFSTGELAAVHAAYAAARPGQMIGIVAPYLPVGQEAITSKPVFSIASGDEAPTQGAILRGFVRNKPAVIVLGRAQEQWGEIVGGYPKGWQDRLQAALERNGYVVVGRWPTAVVLKLLTRHR